jgi:hypothetical protein
MILGPWPWNRDGNVRAGSQAGNGWNSGGRSGDLERMELVSFKGDSLEFFFREAAA